MAVDIQFCCAVENGPNGNSLRGLQNVFYPDIIPGMYSFWISVALTGHDWKAPHSLRIEMRGPARKMLFVIETMTPEVEFDERIPERFRAISGVWQILDMSVPAEGAYSARVYVDGILDGEKELYFARQYSIQ